MARSPCCVITRADGHVWLLHTATHDLPTMSLRFLAAYGLCKRPDVAAFQMLVRAMPKAQSIVMNGHGTETRDFTHSIDDSVEGSVRVLADSLMRAGRGTRESLADATGVSGWVVGVEAVVDWCAAEPGDVKAGSLTRQRRFAWLAAVADGLGGRIHALETSATALAGGRVPRGLSYGQWLRSDPHESELVMAC